MLVFHGCWGFPDKENLIKFKLSDNFALLQGSKQRFLIHYQSQTDEKLLRQRVNTWNVDQNVSNFDSLLKQ